MRRKAEVKGQQPAAPSQKKPFHLEWKNTSQKLAWMAFESHDVLFLLGPAGTGKAQPLDAKVYTPTGHSLMGDLKIGDTICSTDGKKTQVTGIFPQGKMPVFRITFDDDTSCECSESHLWSVSNNVNGWRNRIVDTNFVIKNYKNKHGRCVLKIPITNPVSFNEQKKLLIEPYTMGTLLGDGGFSNQHVTFTNAEEEVLVAVRASISKEYLLKPHKSNKFGYRIVKKIRSGKPNIYINQLRHYGLWGKKTEDKFIPSEYLYSSIKQRVAMLQGLLDTDGYIDKNGSYSLSTSSKKLMKDYQFLVNSLGGVCYITKRLGKYKKNGVIIECKDNYVCTTSLPNDIMPFRLKRKIKLYRPRTKYLPRRIITNVEMVGSKECQCILVDHPSHLYLTDNFIVTHNSHLAVAFAISDILNKKKKKIVLTRPIVEAGEKLGFLPGPQPLDAKILTPNGWTNMGSIKAGDLVIGRDGKPTEVLDVIPKGKKMVYKIYTTENTHAEACEDHPWLTTTIKNRKHNITGSVKTTKEIMKSLMINGKINHQIPRNKPVEFAERKLMLSPYVLGTLLGDGCFTNSVCLASIDEEITNRVNKELLVLNCSLAKQRSSINFNVKAVGFASKKPARKIRFTNVETGYYEEYSSVRVASKKMEIKKATLAYRCKNNLVINKTKYEFVPLDCRWVNPVKNILFSLDLLGKKSNEKFIPDIYKYNSLQNRIDLLQGLMDTDGTIKKSGEASFTTVSRQLAIDVIALVQSLGGRAVLRSRANRNCFINRRKVFSKNISYEFTISLPSNINPFFLSRKASRFNPKYIHGVGIKAIEPVCEKDVQCILIKNDEHLYITNDYIVTHNTFEEKINPYLMPMYDIMDRMVGKESMDRERVNKSLEICPIAYLRGRTFYDSVCILDEAQNATEEQIKLFLTRLGEDSKMIITGDPTQSDLKGEVALTKIVESLKPVKGISVVEFNEASIVRHELVAAILAAWPVNK